MDLLAEIYKTLEANDEEFKKIESDKALASEVSAWCENITASGLEIENVFINGVKHNGILKQYSEISR